MPTLGKPSVKDASVEDAELPDTELPQDNEALFETIRNDPDVQTADMEVQGDWTFGAIADRISMEERVNNDKVNWETFKQVNWKGFEQMGVANLDSAKLPNRNAFNNPEGVSVNELGPDTGPQPFISLGEPAAAPSSGFATGDPGLGTPGTKNYKLDGRAGNSSAVTRNGNVILSAPEGSRAVAFSPPGDASFLQMINRYDWGHQARAVLEALTQMAGLGTDSEYKAPTFATASGPVALMTPFQYSYNRVTGLALLQSTFDVNVASGTTMTVALRQPSGEELTSVDLDVSPGGQSLSVNFLNAPSNGVITLDTGDTAFTVANTEKFPPV